MKDWNKLTVDELKELVKKAGERQKGCSGIHCNDCESSGSYYNGGPEGVPCQQVYKELVKRLEAAGGSEPLPDNVEFTPETTTLDYMLEHGTLLSTADYLSDREKVGEICAGHGCSSCPINADHFAKEWHNGGCGEARATIATAAKMYRLLSKGDSGQKLCQDCAHREELAGGYTYCRAWKNFTVNTMYCGFYLDKKQEK